MPSVVVVTAEAGFEFADTVEVFVFVIMLGARVRESSSGSRKGSLSGLSLAVIPSSSFRCSKDAKLGGDRSIAFCTC